MHEGLRERKKRETRQRISDIATGLFIARGFDNVTVAEIAQAADVSVNTVFNYFGTKEDLFADRQELAVDLPQRVLRERAPGEGVVRAFRRDYLDAIDTRDWRYGLNEGSDVFTGVVNASPALVARLREIAVAREEGLARALAGELGAGPGDLTPGIAAAQILATTRILSDHALARMLAGEPWERIAPSLREQAERAFDLLESGLGDYGARPAADDG
ncbi:TetR/AcrR family transcriptional regulator [Nonomuraea candida]|uniref:TetR/AcrR family transcriptional regulator n=1 Tax=Nonomuraea candida TaxID=359159 RepID=UPI0005BDE554|nr:TetR/AcrR family transcriptional regulator [Nonomuraea candida]